MKQSLAWIEKFISPNKQKDVAALTFEQQLQVLNTLIEASQINPADFTTWASEFFQLPSVDSEFFSQVDLQQIWKKYQSTAFWNAFMLPISEWENQLMIAVPLLPIDFKIDVPHMFVIASPIDLKKAWASVQAPRQAAPPPVEVRSAPPPPPQPQKKIEEKPGANKLNAFSVNIGADFKLIELGPQDEPESPDNAKLEAKIEENASPLMEITATNKFDAPSFNFTSPKIASEKVAEKSTEKIAEKETKPEIEIEKPKEVGPPPVQMKPMAPPPPPLQSATAPPPPPLKVVQTDVPKMASASPTRKGAKSELRRSLAQPHANFDVCVNLAEISDVMFSQMAPNYDMSMLLLSDDQNLKVAYWSGSFKPADENKPNPISVQLPSIFKIVASSFKPYHGYVIANHTNTKFFNEWNSGEIPKHVTVYPIVIAKELVGMWIGATNKTIDQKASLIDMDSLNESCLSVFKKSLKAAA